MLSIKCQNCGGTVQFDENHIATFCSFCGSHLPDMTDYVKRVADLEIQKKQHEMEIEKLKKETRKERAKRSPQIIRLIILVILLLPLFAVMFWFMSMIKH